MQTKLAGRVLYYLLTTGAGLQTLGEEYCDISQVMFLMPTIVVCILFIGLIINEGDSKE